MYVPLNPDVFHLWGFMNNKPTYKDLEQLVHELEQAKSDQKWITRELKKSEERFKVFHDASFSGVIIHDQRIILDCNQGLSDITGFTIEELIGMDGLKLIAPNSHDQLIQNVKRGYDKQYEVEGIRKDGSSYPLLIRGKNMPYKGGDVRVIEFLDITERRTTENHLKEAYNIINNSPAVTFLWKNEQGWPVEFVSDNIVTLFGYSATDFISGRVSYADIIHTDDLERVADEVVTFSGDNKYTKFTHKPYRIITKPGKIKWIDDKTFIRRDEKDKITSYD